MFKKTYTQIDDFTLGVKTIESNEKLLNYINSDFYAGIKLLISVSSIFSVYWKVVFPIIISLSVLLLLSNIKPIGIQINSILSTNYILGILTFLVFFTLLYISRCKKYFILCIEKSKSMMEKDI